MQLQVFVFQRNPLNVGLTPGVISTSKTDLLPEGQKAGMFFLVVKMENDHGHSQTRPEAERSG